MYTKENKLGIYDEIYFLNDNNIAFDKTSISCDAGFNAVASQKEFVEVYKEFEKVSADFYTLSDNVEISAATLDNNIKLLSVNLSTEIDKKFLPVSGGSIENLTVNQDLNVNGNFNAGCIKTNNKLDIFISGDSGHGRVYMELEDGLNSLSVNGSSLSAYIRNSINNLNYAEKTAATGKILDTIREANGIIDVTFRDIKSDDIPELPVTKIINLTSDYATKNDTISLINEIKILHDLNGKKIWIINGKTNLSSSIDTDVFIKDGMINTVELLPSGTDLNGGEHLEVDGPYIRIIWNTDGGNKDTWLPLKKFVNIYTSNDAGLNIDDNYKISLNYNEISEKLEVPALQNYVKELSSPTGIIDTLSANVDNALSSDILAIKFNGHITLALDESKRSLIQILEIAGLFDELNRIKNGSAYKIELVKSSGNNEKSTGRYLTTDGLTLGDGDYIYIHKHGLDTYVNKDKLAISGDNKNVYLANPVHKYDIAELHQFVIDNFVKLSGNNEISNDNRFLGNLSVEKNLIIGNEAEFKNTLSINFDKLYNTIDGITLFGLSASLSTEIYNLSDYVNSISTDLSTDYCQKIEAKSNIYLSSIDNTGIINGGKLNQLNIVKFDALSTYTLCCNENPSLVTISDLVLIEEDQLNAEGERIINVATPELSSDAANKLYVDSTLNTIKTAILTNLSLSTIYEYGRLNKLDEIECELIASALYELIKIFHD